MTISSPATRAFAGVGLGLALLYVIVPALAGALGLLTDTNVVRHPIAVLDQTTRDLGAIQSGPSVEARFRVRNVGNTRLILHMSNGSCDCLTANDADIIVEPGDSHILAAQLNTDKSAGPLTLELNYRTNDPRQPLLKLFVAADVIR